MNYQESILKRYREAFPDKTLKSISKETGIQMTRVFRIFNGYEMKLKEYEAFEVALRNGVLNESKFELFKKFQTCVLALADKDLAYLEIELNHILKVDNFVNKPFIESAGFPAAL